MTINFKRILCISAHLDDCEFGCGGFISKYAKKTDIKILSLAKDLRNANHGVVVKRPLKEAYRAIKALGLNKNDLIIKNIGGRIFDQKPHLIRETLYDIDKKFNPQLIVCPSINDIHQDHKTVAEACMKVFRLKSLWGYEIINSSFNFQPQIFITISDADLRHKIKAVLSYKHQLNLNLTSVSYFDKNAINGLALARGARAGVKYAEAFEVYSMFIK